MKHLLSFLALFVGFCLVTSCVFITTKEEVYGNQTLSDSTQDFDAFNQLTVKGELNITIKQGEQHSVQMVIDENLVEYIKLDYSNGHLKVATDDAYRLVPTNKKQLIITVENLDKLALIGMVESEVIKFNDKDDLNIKTSGNTKLSGVIDANSLSIKTSGNSNIKITGSAQQLTLHSSGASRFKGKSFEVSEAAISISGAGDVAIFVDDHLKANISGAGKISYLGSPTIEQEISGAGTIKQLTE